MSRVAFDSDALVAAVDLAGRSGARQVEIGWNCPHDNADDTDHHCEQTRWYAQAKYKGARLFFEDSDPVVAAEQLARRILDGAKCAHCGLPVALSDRFGLAACRWTREGNRWKRGCA